MATHSTQMQADRIIIKPLAGFYERAAQPLSWLLLRVFVGGALMLEGWPKIIALVSQDRG